MVGPIEAGWRELAAEWLLASTPPMQRQQLHDAFFAGAWRLMSVIMSKLDPGLEPTEADLDRMSLIEAELKAFLADKYRHLPTRGRG